MFFPYQIADIFPEKLNDPPSQLSLSRLVADFDEKWHDRILYWSISKKTFRDYSSLKIRGCIDLTTK